MRISPVIYLLVNSMVLGAKSGRVNTLLQSFRFTSGPEFVGTTNINRGKSSTSAETSENVCRKDASYDVAKVRNIVDIGQSAGNKNIPGTRRREDWFCHFFRVRSELLFLVMVVGEYIREGM